MTDKEYMIEILKFLDEHRPKFVKIGITWVYKNISIYYSSEEIMKSAVYWIYFEDTKMCIDGNEIMITRMYDNNIRGFDIENWLKRIILILKNLENNNF